jgi:molybdopterin-guanine dinucleotide biosynthesis protein A
MALLGAAGRKSGKTELGCALLRRFGRDRPLVAVKVTPVPDMAEEQPPGEGGSLVSHQPDRGFFIWREEDAQGPKDTSRLLRAGASQVFWLVVTPDRTREGLNELLRIIGPDRPMICESNSMRLVAEPGIFLLVQNDRPDPRKKSVNLVRQFVDRVVVSDGKQFDLDLDDVDLVDGRWTIKLPVTAVVMADGTWKANRTKLNPDRGCRKELVEAAASRLRPWFKELYLACAREERCPLVDLPVITVPQHPPALLRTIEAALRAAAHDRVLVTGCDPDRIDVDSIRALLREANGKEHEVVLSPSGSNKEPPSFALLRKSHLTRLAQMIDSGEEEIRGSNTESAGTVIDNS